jgi:hypothetical protein
MKRILSLILALIFASSMMLSSKATSTNMILNGDFEGSDMSQYNNFQLGMPDNMPIIVPGGRSGKCIQMGGDTDGNGWASWINFRIGNLTLKKGYMYHFTGWIKGTENIILDCHTHLYNNLVAPNKHREVYHPIASFDGKNGVQVTKSWTKFDITFIMTNPLPDVDKLLVNATDWNIYFQYAVPQEGVTFPVSSIYFDDLVLTEEGLPSVSSTPASTVTSSTVTASTRSSTVATSSSKSSSTGNSSIVSATTSNTIESSSSDTVSGSSEIVSSNVSGDRSSDPSTNTKPSNNSFTFIIIALAVVLIGGGIVLYYFVIRKKA